MQQKWIGCASSNFRKGRHGYEPRVIVIHIVVGSLESAGMTFNDRCSAVSAHYGVGKTGEIHQFVEESDTTLHAGTVVRPTWRLLGPRVNPNYYTIGIEHEGTYVSADVPTALFDMSVLTCAWLCNQYGLDPHVAIVGHRDYNSTQCPGDVFYARLPELRDRVAEVMPG